MNLEDLVHALKDAPYDHEVLRPLVMEEGIASLLREVSERTEHALDDSDVTWAWVEALERVEGFYAEEERRGWTGPVMKKGKVIKPAQDGPRHPNRVEVRRAAVALRVALAGDTEHMPQSALDSAVRSCALFPEDDSFTQLARDAFRNYGQATGEALSLNEAFFGVMRSTPKTDALRAELYAMKVAEGWVGEA